ncbi:S1 family peptidase [Pseudomonas syringae]|uniref:Uncharacterized protein n=1 Tax=Pseudomonas syringae TaxID=317 RepID=A0A085VGY7_PSESX|nr:serine protease [Pseudomonas syringae]KFE54700.1 hypothetical protein IV01_15250 [Pseudomonas syringae]
MGQAVTQALTRSSTQTASAYVIAKNNAPRARLSGLRSQICGVQNTITGLAQKLEADKPGCTTPHRFSWTESVMNMVHSNYFRDPKDRLANERMALFQAKEHLDALRKEVEPLEEADLIFKTNKKIVKKEARIAEFEAQKKPTHDDRKSIDALRAELDELRTIRDTLLIKHTGRTLAMHAEAGMPLEQMLQVCDLSQPAKMLCNTIEWITTPHMVAGGPGTLALPGLEAANTTSLYSDAPLSQVPNGTSSNVETGPRQLPLQLWAVPQGAAPTPTTSNNPPTIITPPSAGAVADEQQRQRADRLIDEIITSMPNSGYMPQDGNHDPVLALAVQTKDWPAYAKLEVLDAKGQHLATFGKQAASRTNQTITLQRRSNGEYVNAHDPHQSASNQEQLLTLLIQNQPRNSQLGRGGNFWGSDTTAGRIVTLRQQIADLAKAERPELFKAVIHSSCSQTDPGLPAAVKNRFMPLERSPTGTELMRKLHSENPHLTPARLTELLNASPLSATEQNVYLESGHLPTAFNLNKARIEQAVQHELAVDAVYHTRTYNPQADALLRDATTQELLKVNRNLRIFGKGETFDTQTAKAGDVILRDYGNGVYWAYDVPNAQYIEVNADTDSFFRAIASVLQPHEHRALGMTGEPDVRGFREHMGKVVEQSPSNFHLPSSSPMPATTASTTATTSTPTSPPAPSPSGTPTPVKDFGAGMTNGAPSTVLQNANGQNDHLRGIARLTRSDGYVCTATLLDTAPAATETNTPAYMSTAAHCVDTGIGAIDTDKALTGTVEFGYFVDTPSQVYPLKRTTYSNYRNNDLALVEIDTSLQALNREGIRPLAIASHIPANGTDAIVVGAPFGIRPGYLRAAACQSQIPEISAFVGLGDRWNTRRMVTNQCRDTSPGSSGGPVMTRNGEVFGVMAAQSVQSVQQPGGRLQEKFLFNVAIPATHLKDCFTNGVFNANAVNCELFPVFDIKPDHPLMRYAKITLDQAGNPIYPTWRFTFTTDKPYYHYKSVDHVGECEQPQGYKVATASGSSETIYDPIGDQPGIRSLCVIGTTSPDNQFDQGTLRNAFSLSVNLQAAGEPEIPNIEVTHNRMRYTAAVEDNDRKWKQTFMKSGNPDTTDCNSPDKYTTTSVRVFSRKALPMKLCAKGTDHAGVDSKASEKIIS